MGKYYGRANPEIGELMGIALGATIGLYVDDFIAMAVSGIFFSKVVKNYGFTIKDCFRHDFDKEILVECLKWGVKTGLPPMAWRVVGYIELRLWIEFVPQYTTFLSFFQFGAGEICGPIAIFNDIGIVGCNSDIGTDICVIRYRTIFHPT